ncbi:hypothetical protein BD310DRAFT_850149 [Dichomitus squalens]|uniref:Uncharacterized protein n=1 Tax=Dichomitus squalens TaxID=114155 RepID=A0A4Q9PWV5_9APHY|nr:hypothetical protein BD310DRAFT_850149 [Dichomitus squalens]
MVVPSPTSSPSPSTQQHEFYMSRSRSQSRSGSPSRSPSRSLSHHNVYHTSHPHNTHSSRSRSHSYMSPYPSSFALPTKSHHRDGAPRAANMNMPDRPPLHPAPHPHWYSTPVEQENQYTGSFGTFSPSHSSLTSGPSHMSIPFIEMGVRLHRVEQENLEFRRQLAEVRTIVDMLKNEMQRYKVSGDTEDVRGELKRLFTESVIPTDSLKDDEEPGKDCPRARGEFPKLQFYTLREWQEYNRTHKKATRIGDEPVRGKKKSSQGLNHTALYLEDTEGNPAPGDYVNDARKFARTLINLALSSKYKMPRKWGEADLWLHELFYTALRKKFPFFQLCHNNAKGHLFMTVSYYESVTRKWESLYKHTPNINNAQYTIKTPSDEEQSDQEPPEMLDVVPASALANPPAHKRASETNLLAPKPAKQARTAANGDEQDLSISQPDKGKGRASTSLLSIISPAR